jgi:capping protein alpha
LHRKSIHKSLSKHVKEHYPSASLGVYPSPSEGSINLLTVSSKYSPSNFYNGRFRSHYTYSPSSQSITGTITVDVHYYEDGNVRLLTNKSVKETVRGDVVSTIAGVERRYQEELNRGFAGLSEGAFRGLRRQLPVTRVKVDWEKIGAMKLGQDIAGPRR